MSRVAARHIRITAHEFKPGFQFESGALSFGARPGKMGKYFLKDMTEDVDAYKRQKLFDPESLPDPLSEGITISNVRRIYDPDKKEFPYSDVPENGKIFQHILTKSRGTESTDSL